MAVEVVFDKLGSGFIKEFSRLWRIKRDLERLESTLSTIKDVIEDAEDRSIREKALRNWLAKLKDAAYDADDLLEDFQMEAPKQHDHMIKKVWHFFSHIAFSIIMCYKIKKMRVRLDEIVEGRIKFHLEKRNMQDWRIQNGQGETMLAIDETCVCGRDDDKETIIKFLLELQCETEHVPIISIVGFGGLGKTTLCQYVYNDARVGKEQFHPRMWVYVSQDFDLQRLVKTAIASATWEICDLHDSEYIGNRLKEILREKKFLLVLDDVSNEDGDKWETLKDILKVGASGSKIIATTRSETVASVMRSTTQHHIKGLSEDDCWTLFKQRAFGEGGEEEDNPRIVTVGQEIVKKCGGVPLAAKALGSIMRYKKGEEAWRAVRNSDIWKQTREGDMVIDSLRRSYTNLPSPLKQCFAYCSIFPKGHWIDKDALIKQWVALGFISALDHGNDYFNHFPENVFPSR